MAININNQYASVYQATAYDNAVMANVTTSTVDKRDDSREYSRWRARFVGKAFDKAKHLQDGAFIVIGSGMVKCLPKKKDGEIVRDSNGYQILETSVTIFDFEMYENSNSNSSRRGASKPVDDDETDDLPF